MSSLMMLERLWIYPLTYLECICTSLDGYGYCELKSWMITVMLVCADDQVGTSEIIIDLRYNSITNERTNKSFRIITNALFGCTNH